jgi:hypothetical protein
MKENHFNLDLTVQDQTGMFQHQNQIKPLKTH